MSYFVILGLGSFSVHLLHELKRRKHRVTVMDKDEEKVQQVEEIADEAITADISNKNVLKRIDVEDADCVVVNLGEHSVDDSIFITMYLKERGVKNVVVKVMSEEHESAIKKVGADLVVFPERDTAARLASFLEKKKTLGHFIDALPIENNYSIVEIKEPPDLLVGKTLGEIDLRKRHGLYVIAVRQQNKKTVIVPPPNYKVGKDDILVVVGEDSNIKKFTESG